jgi:hypothetical protein
MHKFGAGESTYLVMIVMVILDWRKERKGRRKVNAYELMA